MVWRTARRSVVGDRVTRLKKMIEDAPKSFKWKMRARVGERVQWYELPEADKEVVDSRIGRGHEPPDRVRFKTASRDVADIGQDEALLCHRCPRLGQMLP